MNKLLIVHDVYTYIHLLFMCLRVRIYVCEVCVYLFLSCLCFAEVCHDKREYYVLYMYICMYISVTNNT